MGLEATAAGAGAELAHGMGLEDAAPPTRAARELWVARVAQAREGKGAAPHLKPHVSSRDGVV